MRSRLVLLSCCIAFSFCASSQAATLTQQRTYYDEAMRALGKGDAGPYRRYAAALRNYPLEPYLAYEELNGRIRHASTEEIERFLAQHGDLPQIRWMKLRWLSQLAGRGDWTTFDRHYSPKLGFTELDCLNARGYLQRGRQSEAWAEAQRLWLAGKSQPNQCDPLFEQWSAAGQLTEELRWQRTRLAVEAGNYSLASFLARQLARHGNEAQLMIEVAQNPQLIANTARFAGNGRIMGDVVGMGLRRLARQDPEKALGLLELYAKRLEFSDDEKVALARQIGLSLAKRFDPRALEVAAKYDPTLRDNNLSEWRARLLLRLGRWKEAHELISRFPEDLAKHNRWRYWRARSFELATHDSKAAVELYRPVAQERDYYGFLAADRIQAPYRLNHQPLRLDKGVIDRVRNAPGIRRALEFHARGKIADGRREWYHATQFFERDEKVAQARIGYDMQWYFPAIRTISQAEYWDDLDIRFPMAYRDELVRAARQRQVHPAWAFAITRQESGFMTDARSPVGATGLMQLMPATAKETAKRYNIPYTAQHQLINPALNIQLGTAYMNQIYGQFKGNRVLASAAYNAGPGRVRQWLRDASHLSFDVWVENIPFDETRQYVQNVLTYSVIYGQKLNAPQPLVEWHERFFEDQ